MSSNISAGIYTVSELVSLTVASLVAKPSLSDFSLPVLLLNTLRFFAMVRLDFSLFCLFSSVTEEVERHVP